MNLDFTTNNFANWLSSILEFRVLVKETWKINKLFQKANYLYFYYFIFKFLKCQIKNVY